MFYEAELRFLCDTLQKCHIQVHIIDPTLPLEQRLEALGLPAHLGSTDTATALDSQLPPVQPRTLYRIFDHFGCHYLYCMLPSTARESILLVGPYMTQSPTDRQFMEWGERHSISPAQVKYLQHYYENIPVLQNASYLFALLDAFGERLWGTDGFILEDVVQATDDRIIPVDPDKISDEDTLWKMRALEQRYAYENELIDAVAKGQSHKADMFLATFSHLSFEQRSADPLRNTKNYCVIMNTLLRKAAEQGGVHPLHLDHTSSGFAFRIEQAVSMEAVGTILSEMFHTYCRLVRKKSLKGYSPPVQKAIALIDADLAGSLNLRTLAQSLNISSSYLSSLFKKETGQTLTDYIVARRMDLARQLLSKTKLQVQTVAQHCGILDVQYFSKLFKKATGMTPKEFRQSVNH